MCLALHCGLTFFRCEILRSRLPQKQTQQHPNHARASLHHRDKRVGSTTKKINKHCITSISQQESERISTDGPEERDPAQLNMFGSWSWNIRSGFEYINIQFVLLLLRSAWSTAAQASDCRELPNSTRNLWGASVRGCVRSLDAPRLRCVQERAHCQAAEEQRKRFRFQGLASRAAIKYPFKMYTFQFASNTVLMYL